MFLCLLILVWIAFYQAESALLNPFFFINSRSRQCVGMLISVERTQKDFEESDQIHLITMLAQLHTKLVGMFEKYVDEQLKFIEEARNKTKRKGVLPFIRIFPVCIYWHIFPSCFMDAFL